MSLAAWILAALLSQPVSRHDRAVSPEIKREQIETVAESIEHAVSEYRQRWPGDRRELAALLLVTARFESGLALYVHSGNCPRPSRPEECDGGRARGLWQQQVSSTSSYEAWLRLIGTDRASTRHAAREAARALTRARWQCRSLERRGGDWIEMTISAYAGRGCVGGFRGRKARVLSVRRLLKL